jgi:hypothetical protein
MNVLFTVTMIIESLFALGFIIAPGAMLGRFGVTLDAAATTIARMFGSALIGFPILLWHVRKSTELQFRRAAVRSMFAYYLISCYPLLSAQLKGQMNSMGWSVIGLHAALLAWYGYYLVKWARFIERSAK